MPLWESKDAELASGGNSTHNWEAFGVSIDSRNIEKGDLFIALIGENQDGHKYVLQALQNGAAVAMVNYIPEGVSDEAPLLVVQDTTEALWKLARFRREQFNGKVALITGSVGKTSTKEMLAHALEHQGKVHATIGNLNNHYGLPLTMARMPLDTDYAVLEVGMNHAGEISPLSVLSQPDVTMITNVEAVHLEFFESVEKIADAKAEVFDGLKEGGTAILNRDNAHYMRLKKTAQNLGITEIVRFGKGEGAEFRLLEYNAGEVVANCNGEQLKYRLGISGEHQAGNSLGVFAVVNALGADIKKAADSLRYFEAEAGRGKQYAFEVGGASITLIDDTYNASPAAVASSVCLLQSMRAKEGRIIAVLGDMFELGDKAEALHKNLLQKLVENKVDLVFTAGDLMQKLYNVLPEQMRGGHAETSTDLADVVLQALAEGDVVLVKGSRGMKMEQVVNHILEEGKKNNAV